MGWKLNALAFTFALWCMGLGAFVVGIPILLYLGYRFWSNKQARPRGTGGPRWMIYLGALLILLSLVAVAEHGTYSPLLFGFTGVTLLIIGIFPHLVNDVIEEVTGPAKELFSRMSGKESGEPAVCVKLTQVPLEYLDPKKAVPEEKLLKFQRLARTLAESHEKVQLRIEFANGAGRILFRLTNGSEERAARLLQLLKSQLPEFRPELTEFQDGGGYTVPIEGVPEHSVDPVGPLAKFFVENRLEGGYGVTMSPTSVNLLSRWAAGRSQKRLAEESGFQHVTEDKTTTTVDHSKQVQLEASIRGIDRLLARRPVRVSVLVWAKDELVARQAAGILAGTLSSHDRFGGLKIRRSQSSGRSSWRRSTLMLSSEAAPYLWLPQSSLGMKVAPSAEFQAPLTPEGDIVLGEVVGLSGRTGHHVRVKSDELVKHVFVTGMTGSGKTTSCFSLLLQLNSLQVPFLVIEPVKSEYRSLLEAIPAMQVFTIGEEAAPFRLNIFEPPPGVSVKTHLDSLEAAWNSSFTMYAPLPYVIKRVLVETYQSCGWNIKNETHGKPIALADFRRAAEFVTRRLGYDPNVTMNIESAMKVRVDNLELGKEGDLFNTTASTPLETILNRPTVIELRSISHPEEKAFVTALLLSNLAEYLGAKGLSKSLKHVTIIEEAHRLLPNISTVKGDPEGADSRKVMVEHFGNMLAEARAYGEGLVVVDQIPTKILPDAIKNTATKIVHRVPAADDREVLAGAMGMSEEQAQVLTSLKPGEAVIHIQNHPLPIMVAVPDRSAEVGISVGELNDEDVKRTMAEFYLRHPTPGIPTSALKDRLLRTVDDEWFRLKFKEGYNDVLTKRTPDKLLDLVSKAAIEIAANQSEFDEAVRKLLQMGTEFYLPLDEKDRERFPREVMAYLARAERHDRRS